MHLYAHAAGLRRWKAPCLSCTWDQSLVLHTVPDFAYIRSKLLEVGQLLLGWQKWMYSLSCPCHQTAWLTSASLADTYQTPIRLPMWSVHTIFHT